MVPLLMVLSDLTHFKGTHGLFIQRWISQKRYKIDTWLFTQHQ